MKYRQENTFSGSFIYVKGEDEEECKYDVTGYISLADAYIEKDCKYEVIYNLISMLMKEGRRLESEGKNMDGFILNPQYVFLHAETYNLFCHADFRNKAIAEKELEQKIKFIYYPGKTDTSLDKELLKLAEFLLEHTDYNDKDAVNIAYDFYLRVYRKNYVFDDLLK